MKFVPIHTRAAYKAYLKRAEQLVGKTGRASADELEVLQALIEQWERRHFDLSPPTPLEAIRFRMQQHQLKPRDLEPYIGSRARVSQVLSGIRPLSIDMIRALNQHLGIPAASLIAAPRHRPLARPATPSKAALKKLKSFDVMKATESFRDFLDRTLGIDWAEALLRKTRTERTNAKSDQAALTAWCGAVMARAKTVKIAKSKTKARWHGFARTLARLSIQPDGPLLARDELASIGVILITLDHLPGTYLDGAAMRRSDGTPIIAMTLRYDRVDNFWFTLLHEFCHVLKHLHGQTTMILDDLQLKDRDNVETEADDFAQEALIPSPIWTKVSAQITLQDIVRIAKAAGVHPAIVAGRWQREHNDYRRFSRLLGRGQVRCLFK